MLAGYDLREEPYLWTNEDIPDMLQMNVEFWHWLQEYISQPLPLLQCVRKWIRKTLGVPINKKLEELKCLPRYLKNYILMMELKSDV